MKSGLVAKIIADVFSQKNPTQSVEALIVDELSRGVKSSVKYLTNALHGIYPPNSACVNRTVPAKNAVLQDLADKKDTAAFNTITKAIASGHYDRFTIVEDTMGLESFIVGLHSVEDSDLTILVTVDDISIGVNYIAAALKERGIPKPTKTVMTQKRLGYFAAINTKGD
jgi:hypothetical protein